jgi:hypothetical protein
MSRMLPAPPVRPWALVHKGGLCMLPSVSPAIFAAHTRTVAVRAFDGRLTTSCSTDRLRSASLISSHSSRVAMSRVLAVSLLTACLLLSAGCCLSAACCLCV